MSALAGIDSSGVPPFQGLMQIGHHTQGFALGCRMTAFLACACLRARQMNKNTRTRRSALR